MASPDHTIAPCGAGKRPRRGKNTHTGEAPLGNPGGAQNAPAGRAICYKLSVKTPLWEKEFAFFCEKQTRKQQFKDKQTSQRAKCGRNRWGRAEQNHTKSSGKCVF